jgi:hypothetical protein
MSCVPGYGGGKRPHSSIDNFNSSTHASRQQSAPSLPQRQRRNSSCSRSAVLPVIIASGEYPTILMTHGFSALIRVGVGYSRDTPTIAREDRRMNLLAPPKICLAIEIVHGMVCP